MLSLDLSFPKFPRLNNPLKMAIMKAKIITITNPYSKLLGMVISEKRYGISAGCPLCQYPGMMILANPAGWYKRKPMKPK